MEELNFVSLETEKLLEVEAEVPLSKLSISLAKKLRDFEPFGVGNPEPILSSNNVRVSNLRTVGDGKHLKGQADDLNFIAFGMGNLMSQLVYPERSRRVNVAYNLAIDKWDGREKLQLKVKDLQII